MNMLLTKDCEHCNKSSLSLLLLRPSPIAINANIAPLGSSAVVSSHDVLDARVRMQSGLEQSRIALRLLRNGYVHVFIPSPPPGVSQWQHYRVSDNGDLYKQSNPEFDKPSPQVCARKEHNALGMRLLHIPQAHKIAEIWIAFSANMWNDTLKQRNAANARAMQHVSLRSSSGMNEFLQPTPQQLQQRVLEFALSQLSTAGVTQHDFPFVSLVGSAESMVEQMRRAAECHPLTKGHEKAIVLADPVGFAAELNAIRLLRHELYVRDLERPENAHPLNSSSAVLGLKRVALDANLAQSAVEVSPLMLNEAYRARQWPAGTEWQPLSEEDRRALLAQTSKGLGQDIVTFGASAATRALVSQPNMGRVLYPDHEERARRWAEGATAETWQKLEPHYDEGARAAWVSAFTARMRSQHLEPLKIFETDWRAGADDALTLAYFEQHFDEADPNPRERTPSSAGVAYARENQYINAPAPFTEGAVLDRYVAQLQKPITDKSAIALRALVGNQKEVIDVVHEQLTADAGTTGMRDKTYDFLKGVLGLDVGKAALVKFNWMGDALAMFSVGQLSAFSGAVMSAAARSQTASPALAQAMSRVQFLWGVQQTLEIAVRDGLAGRVTQLPVLVTMRVPVDEALRVLRARNGQALGSSRSRVKRLRGRQATVSLALLTDTDALKAAQGNAQALLQQPNAGEVRIGRAPAGVAAAAASGSAIVLSEAQFLKLYEDVSAKGATASSSVKQAITASRSADIRNVAMSIDGRLALGSIVVQGIGLYRGLNSLTDAKDAKQVRDAWYGIYDSTAGVLGGLLETWAVVMSSRIGLQVGAVAAQRSVGLGMLRAVAYAAGAAGGLVNAIGSWAKTGDSTAKGDDAAAVAYQLSTYAFAGLTASSLVSAGGAVAQTFVARGASGAVARTLAARFAAQSVLAVVGGTAITVSGIGLVFLAGGMIFTVGAVALTPKAMQRWMSRSYFGRDPSWFDWDGKREDMFTKGEWKAELQALEQALIDGAEENK